MAFWQAVMALVEPAHLAQRAPDLTPENAAVPVDRVPFFWTDGRTGAAPGTAGFLSYAGKELSGLTAVRRMLPVLIRQPRCDIGRYGSAVSIGPIVVTVQPGVTDWLTGIGTVAVALVAVGVSLYAERRADKRVQAERIHAAEVLAEERRLADARLAEERAIAERRFLQERDRTVNAEQHAAAWAVEILPGTDGEDESVTSSMTVLVGNMSTRTITQVVAQFSPDGNSLVPKVRAEHIRRAPDGLVSVLARPSPDGMFRAAHSGILAPGARMRLWSDEVADRELIAPFPVVRWCDWLGQWWEHRQGKLRKISEDEPWTSW